MSNTTIKLPTMNTVTNKSNTVGNGTTIARGYDSSDEIDAATAKFLRLWCNRPIPGQTTISKNQSSHIYM